MIINFSNTEMDIINSDYAKVVYESGLNFKGNLSKSKLQRKSLALLKDLANSSYEFEFTLYEAPPYWIVSVSYSKLPPGIAMYFIYQVRGDLTKLKAKAEEDLGQTIRNPLLKR